MSAATPSMFSGKAMLENFKKGAGVYFETVVASPKLIWDFYLFLFKSFMALFNYHILTLPAKPLHSEVVLVIGSDTALGRAFAGQTVKMNGTVVCIDSSKEKGDLFVKSLNDTARDTKAFFYECDLNKMENLSNIVDTVSKDLGDVSILVNCTLNNIVPNYFNAYKLLLPIMKSNGRGKGRFIFIRTDDAEVRNAIQSLYDSIETELKVLNKDEIFASLAHVYPRIGEGNEKNKIFGSIKPDDAAKMILEGVSKGQRDIYVPSYMAYFTWPFKFMPGAYVNMWEKLFYGDK